VLRLERRISRDGMVSLDGNLYSVPDSTRRRSVEVQVLTDEVRIFEDQHLVATHPVLEGRGKRLVAQGHRQVRPARRNPAPADQIQLHARAGEVVGRRPLAFYAAVGRRLAQRGARR
jgi:hypothetical protein